MVIGTGGRSKTSAAKDKLRPQAYANRGHVRISANMTGDFGSVTDLPLAAGSRG